LKEILFQHRIRNPFSPQKRFKSFSSSEYDLRMLPRVFLMEMFDLRGKELKYAKELLRNYYRKSVQNSVSLQDMWVELKL